MRREETTMSLEELRAKAVLWGGERDEYLYCKSPEEYLADNPSADKVVAYVRLKAPLELLAEDLAEVADDRMYDDGHNGPDNDHKIFPDLKALAADLIGVLRKHAQESWACESIGEVMAAEINAQRGEARP